jgi:gas vesicle protein
MYERRGGSVFGAFLIGGLIGAVLGLLFAPRSGKETRDMLGDKANDYWGEAGEMYSQGMEKVGAAVDTGKQTASEKSEQLRSKIDEARERLQEQVAKSAEVARDKVAETTPAVHDAIGKAAESTKAGVDKAAEGTKSGFGAAAGKTADTLDFVAKKAAKDDSLDSISEIPADPASTPLPEV